MTKEILKQALEALETCREDEWHSEDDFGMEQTYDEDKVAKALTALRTTLKQPRQEPKPVAHPVIVGALFDFMGYLTSRKKRIVLSAADEAGPAVDAITDFAKMRGLSFDDARVQDWVDALAPPPLPEQEPVTCRFCHSKKGCWAWQCYHCGEIDDVQQPAALPVQKPVAWMSSDRAWMWSDYSKAIAAVANIPTLTLIPLYAAPPQRPWQGLTTEEIMEIIGVKSSDSDWNVVGVQKWIHAIEAKLKGKNHG
jgi:hypothetical protein